MAAVKRALFTGAKAASAKGNVTAMDPEAMATETMTRAAAMGTLGGVWDVLPDPDEVLAAMGETSAILARITRDAHVTGCMQSRKLATLARLQDGEVWEAGAREEAEPDAAARRLRDMLVEDLWDIDTYQIAAQVLDAPYYGFIPVELVWRHEGGAYRLAKLQPRPQEWFAFDTEGAPVFREMGGPVYPPEHKLVMARHFPSYANPYGLRLLSRCFWPMTFKVGGFQFLVRFIEKFGAPWLLGRYRSGADKKEQAAVLASLGQMAAMAYAAAPEGTSMEVMNKEGGKGDGGPHGALIALCNAEMSKALVGQTLTTEVGERGSLAAGKVHQDVLDSFAVADQVLLRTFWDEVAWEYARVNAPGVASPSWRLVEDEELQAERADRDGKLQAQGVEFLPAYYEEVYGLRHGHHFRMRAPNEEPPTAEGDPGRKGRPVKPDGGEEPGGAFAEGDPARPFTPDQQALEDLIARSLPEGLAGAEATAAAILEAVNRSNSFEELEEQLAALLRDGEGFEEALERALYAADLLGRFAAQAEAGGK